MALQYPMLRCFGFYSVVCYSKKCY